MWSRLCFSLLQTVTFSSAYNLFKCYISSLSDTKVYTHGWYTIRQSCCLLTNFFHHGLLFFRIWGILLLSAQLNVYKTFPLSLKCLVWYLCPSQRTGYFSRSQIHFPYENWINKEDSLSIPLPSKYGSTERKLFRTWSHPSCTVILQDNQLKGQW